MADKKNTQSEEAEKDVLRSDAEPKERKRMARKLYESELIRLQEELVKLQYWIKEKGLKVVVLFEGRDAAGKGGVIKRIAERTNPRIVKVVALGTPSDREKTQWYFQRYVAELPAAGEMVLFDRSWYNRAGVERVMGPDVHPRVRDEHGRREERPVPSPEEQREGRGDAEHHVRVS